MSAGPDKTDRSAGNAKALGVLSDRVSSKHNSPHHFTRDFKLPALGPAAAVGVRDVYTLITSFKVSWVHAFAIVARVHDHFGVLKRSLEVMKKETMCAPLSLSRTFDAAIAAMIDRASPVLATGIGIHYVAFKDGYSVRHGAPYAANQGWVESGGVR